MLMLSETQVRQCLSMEDCIEVNRRALASLPEGGNALVPTRLGLSYPTNSQNSKDWSLFKPAAYYGDGSIATLNKNATTTSSTSEDGVEMGMKLVSVRAENPSKGLPLVPATVLLLDAPTGQVQAVLSGTYLTGARTAAGSAVATELVAASSNVAMRNLVVFGAGLQAECHIEALRCVQPSISRITIVNRSLSRANELLDRVVCHPGSSSADVTGQAVLLDDMDGIRKELRDANVVVTSTNTETPLFDGSWLPPGCHVNGVGSYTTFMQEVDQALVNRSRVLIDTPESLDVGDLKHLDRNSHPWKLLGEVVTMDDLPSWLQRDTNDNAGDSSVIDCTFFKSTGTAIQDVMTATLVVKRARELGLGTEVDMS